MWHEQNFRDRIQTTEPMGYTNKPKSPTEKWKDVCTNLTRLMQYILTTPPEEFDEDGVREKLNDLIIKRIELPPKEAIGLAEAFMEAPQLPKEAISMLLGNFLFQLYKKFYPGNPFKDDSTEEEQTGDA